MKILVNKKIKGLFFRVFLLAAGATLVSAVFIAWGAEAAPYLLACPPCMGALALAALYQYFQEQNRALEDAVAQIKNYSDGGQNARLECDEEGELYRLFHEVNALIAILNAHAENERKTKAFLKDIISDISHQLKTPLAALNIYNGILQQEVQELPAAREFTALSEQELDRIEGLVQNLLKIAKLDAGAILLEKNEENVAQMVAGIESHFAYRAEQEGKALSLSGSDAVVLCCDRTWLAEAISNLVKNAFDHTKKGDAIRVEWKQFACVVQITVSDDGSGIHPEDLHHIFKRFYRSRYSKDTQGVGLGLSLAKSVVEAHNGTIEVDSVLGRGTRFTVNFLIPTKR